MKKINNKGFTLMEVLAVVVIIAIIGLIAVPNIISIINIGKNSSYDILVKDITVAAIKLHEELSFTQTTIYKYNETGKNGAVNVTNNQITTNLQTLVSNGFLTGTNNDSTKNIDNKNAKIIINPKSSEDMGGCEITITKKVDSNTFETNYTIESNSNDAFCPNNAEYEEALNK